VKIGILGGTFNPVHIGHLILAEEIREKLSLDRVIFVPANIPPHKASEDIVAARDRFNMLKLAIKGNKFFAVSDLEIKRSGYSYTIDTIRQFKKTYFIDELYFITGSDLLNYLKEWKDLEEIIGMVKFVVATRPGYPLEKIPAYIKTLAIRAVDISAFEVRKAIKEKRSFKYLVPEVVSKYIVRKGLYQ